MNLLHELLASVICLPYERPPSMKLLHLDSSVLGEHLNRFEPVGTSGPKLSSFCVLVIVRVLNAAQGGSGASQCNA